MKDGKDGLETRGKGRVKTNKVAVRFERKAKPLWARKEVVDVAEAIIGEVKRVRASEDPRAVVEVLVPWLWVVSVREYLRLKGYRLVQREMVWTEEEGNTFRIICEVNLIRFQKVFDPVKGVKVSKLLPLPDDD